MSSIREQCSGIGGIALALFLILYGVMALMSIAIPVWVAGLLAFAAGLLLLVGR